MSSVKPFKWQLPYIEGAVTALMEHRICALTLGTGMGKTFVSLFALKRFGFQPYVVCPKSVIPAWQEACDLVGVEPIKIVNYEMAIKEDHYGGWKIKNRQFLYDPNTLPNNAIFLFDEAHRCGGMTSKQSKLLIGARRSQRPIMMLSATLADSPLKMKAIGFALGLHNLHTYRYWLPTVGVTQNHFGALQFVGGERTMHRLRDKLATKLVTGNSSDVPDFPSNRLETMLVPVNSKGLDKEYQQALDAMELEAETELVATLRARQKSEYYKCPAIVEMCKDYVETGSNVVVFLNFRESLDFLSKKLKCNCCIVGGQSSKERQDNIERFQNNEENIILCMVSAGGVGISLHDLNDRPRVALVNPTWSSVDFIQALGRIHRAGSKSKAVQKILYAADSEVEKRMRDKVTKKINNINSLTDSDLSIICD